MFESLTDNRERVQKRFRRGARRAAMLEKWLGQRGGRVREAAGF